MTPPSLLFGFLIPMLYGAIFHFLRGGVGGRPLRYLIFSLAGFWIGQFVGDVFSLHLFGLGSIHLGVATIGSMIVLFLGHWLSLIETEEYE